MDGREFHILSPWYLILNIPELVLVFGKEYTLFKKAEIRAAYQ